MFTSSLFDSSLVTGVFAQDIYTQNDVSDISYLLFMGLSYVGIACP